MNLQEAMETRKSRRSYLPEAIAPKKIQTLHDMIWQYNMQSGLAMELIPDGSAAFQGLRKSYGMFTGVRTIIVLKGKAIEPHLKEKAGYYGELIVLEATKLGLGTCWVGGTYDKGSGLFSLKEGESLVCVITVGITPKEKTVHEKIIYTLAHGRSKPLEKLYHAQDDPPAWFLSGVKAASLAPSSANAQPVRFHYSKESAAASVLDTGGFRLVDLGIAKAHFALAAKGTFAFGNGGKFTKAESLY